MIAAALLILAFILGGIAFRARGGWPDIPKPIEQLFFCAPLGFIAILSLGLWGILIYALCVLFVMRGHGNNMDLGGWTHPADDEWYEPTIKWAKPKLSPYWYDALGLAVSGFSYTFLLAFVSLPLAASGALKAPAYMIGKIIAEKTPLKIEIHKFIIAGATEWGEFLTGGFLWLCWAAYIINLFI